MTYVIALTADLIKPSPDFASTTFDASFITGLGTLDQRMLILIDIEKLMSSAEMALVEQTVH